MSHARRVPLRLGDREWVLYYDLNAICELKTQHGINLLAPETLDTRDPVVLRALIWAGLLHAGEQLSPADVGQWLDLDTMGPAADAFAQAFGGAAEPMGERAKELATAGPPGAGETSTGTPSSASATES